MGNVDIHVEIQTPFLFLNTDFDHQVEVDQGIKSYGCEGVRQHISCLTAACGHMF